MTVPQAWDGVVINVRQNSGVLAGYGDFFFAQAEPLTLNAPAGFPLDQFLEVLFRVVGVKAPEARNLRQKFAANPAAFFPIPTRYEMDIREVRLNFEVFRIPVRDIRRVANRFGLGRAEVEFS